MMIGGEFNTPADWLRAGNAIKTVDDFAAAHGGNAPVLVFVDSGGAFNNDTECVNGTRGNAADHLTKDVVPFMEATYGVSANPANWGIVGWSMGGTCAVDLAVMHPDEFSTFEDIAGDLGPNSGTPQQTIDRLFGGDKSAYARFDPTAVITEHGPYDGVSGWFDISGTASVTNAATVVNADNSGGNGLGGRDTAGRTSDQTSAADSLCGLGAANGIACAVVSNPASTTGRSPPMRSRRPCLGCRARSARPECPPSRCPHPPRHRRPPGGRQVTRSVVGFGDRRGYRWRCA